MGSSKLFVFAVCSLSGFGFTVAINICSHFNIELSELAIFFPQAFAIALAFPLVKMCDDTMPVGSTGNLTHIFSATQGKQLAILAAVAIYGFVNFFYFMGRTLDFPRGEAPIYYDSGIFSSGQMIFFYLEFTVSLTLMKITNGNRVT